MIKKCEHPGCTKAGVCRAPKTRELKEYWLFCKEHAAEYNKNWNYYADMTPEEIEADWETRVFGTPLKDDKNNNKSESEYIKFLNDFLTGRATFDKTPPRITKPANVISALKVFDLPLSASWREITTKYRALAKKHHPDTSSDKNNSTQEFTKISNAYDTLKKYFGKK